MHKEIVVVETLKAIQGKKNELRQALIKLVQISRRASGCLRYDLLEPIEKSDEFLVLMKWKRLEDLRNHERSHYVEDFVKNYDQILYGEAKVTEWTDLKV